MAPARRQDLAARGLKFTVRSLRFVSRLSRETACPRRVVEQTAGALTGVGANLSETRAPLSRKQLVQCYAVALREAHESMHWLQALLEVGTGDAAEAQWLLAEAREFVAILTVSIRKLRELDGNR